MIDGKSIKDNSPYFDASQAWKNRDPRFDGTFFTIMDEVVTTTGKKMNWRDEWLVNTPTGYDIQKRGVWYGEESWTQRVDVHLMRLPRVYLHIAEAYALQANPDFEKCSEYVEKVRSRARRLHWHIQTNTFLRDWMNLRFFLRLSLIPKKAPWKLLTMNQELNSLQRMLSVILI